MAKIINNYEGFWKSIESPDLPLPKSSNDQWFKANKKVIVDSLKNIQRVVKPKAYKGSSVCRMCHSTNGSEEYACADAVDHKQIWYWPSGLLHYIEEHNVCPSEAFLTNVLKVDISKKLVDRTLANVKSVKTLLLMMSIEEREEIFEFLNRGKQGD